MTNTSPTWPATKIVKRRLADLKPFEQNSRTHSPDQIAQIARSINEWGWTVPILIDEGNTIIAGHARVLAAQDLDLDRVPCMVAAGWTEAQKRAYVIADNKLAENAGWDFDILGAEVAALADLDFDLSLTGFDDGEIADLIPGEDGLTDPDDVPELPEVVITQPGDTWLIGDHRLRCGDATNAEDVAALLGAVRPKLLITSPPYNQKIDGFKPSGMHKGGGWVEKVERLAYADSLPEGDYQTAQRAALALWFDVMENGASVFYNHKNRYRNKSVISPLLWIPGPFNLRQEIVWSRPGSVTQNARMFLPTDERIYWMTKGSDFYFNDTTEIKTWSTVWAVSLETNKSHAVGFPVELPRRCIVATSHPGDAVIDPYVGSGTSIIAGEMEGRHIYAMELAPAYCDLAVRRWQDFTGKDAVRESDGLTFGSAQNT